MRYVAIILFLFLLVPDYSFSQLWIRFKYTPEQLVKEKLVKPQSGIRVTDVSYRGSRHSIAYFVNNTTGFAIKRGLLLTTGYANSVSSPNRRGNSGVPLGYPGDRDLSRLVRNRTNDAAVLQIEFIPYTDTIQFRYFFGSEEYPEYVNKGVNDVFAFFIRKADEMEYDNLAHLPDGTPVTVDNINSRKNKQYYIPNKTFFGYDYDAMQENPEATIRSQEFSYDGFTTELIAATRVEPYETYELKIVIADVGDDLYDSGVFLEQGSFSAPNFKKLAIHDVEFKMEKILHDFDQQVDVKYQKDTLVLTSHIAFEFNKHEINDQYNQFLSGLAKVLEETPDVILNINGHTDSVGADSYNMSLSQKRALSIANFLVNKGVRRNRMKCNGFGSSRPIANDSTESGRALNRRVEFHFNQIK
jgi:outer membrane protein OmpA-like peptidoglycan-associated protein